MSTLLVLCYHAISPAWTASLAVTPDAFERQLTFLSRAGWASSTFTEVIRRPPTRRTVVVTFDDAFGSVRAYAKPVLDRLGMVATVFAPTDYITAQQPLGWPGLDTWLTTPFASELTPMSWDELGNLADQGWEIGSHTCSHPLLTRLSDAAADEELERSRQECRDRLGRDATALAYPYGDFSERIAARARHAGYEAAATLSWPTGTIDHYCCPRIGIYRRDTARRFRLKTMLWAHPAYRTRIVGLRQPVLDDSRPPAARPQDPTPHSPARAGRGRLLVFSDFSYRTNGGLTAELPFSLFVARLGREFDHLTLVGRLSPGPGRFPYRLDGIEFVALPYYQRGSHLLSVLGALPAGMVRFWRALDDADAVWVLGPHPPQALVFAVLAKLRGRSVALGVRQQLRQLIRHRHPGQRRMQITGDLLELAFRAMARLIPVVAVGPHIADQYRAARSLHVTYVSLLGDADILAADQVRRDWDEPTLRLLSVGRLDPEKNPLLLVEIIRRLVARDERWQLDVCGEGSLAEELQRRVTSAGLNARVRLHGDVPFGTELWDMYRRSHALLHVSHTEGVPQVLLEAFAARLPVVATAVGGVPGLVTGRGLLIEPDDPDAAVAAIERLLADPAARERRVAAAASEVAMHTVEAECLRLAAFLAAEGP